MMSQREVQYGHVRHRSSAHLLLFEREGQSEKKKDSLLYADEMGECTKAENKLKKDYCDVQFMQSFSSKVQEYKIL